jgi:hypothetical protein
VDKIIEIGAQWRDTGEPTVQAVVRWNRGRAHIEKNASAIQSPAWSYIQGVNPRPGKTIVLVNAMGAYETYDSNRNGDGFPARAFKVGVHAPSAGRENNQWRAGENPLAGWVTDEQTLPRHYQTFQTAGIYEHHQNKDASKSLGRVERAFWNDYMQRVELLLEIENSRQPLLIQRINDGEFPAVSMGCRVPYDVCTKCGNRAPTRAQYCDHLKFQMNFIDPDTGEIWCALNPNPFFFDISFVFRPADPTGFMMRKVAGIYRVQTGRVDYSGEERIAAFNAKQADVRKVSDIQKEVLDGQVTAAKPDIAGYPRALMQQNVNALSTALDSDLDALNTVPLGDAVATLNKAGCFLSCGEFARLFMKRAGLTIRPDTLDKLALLQPLILEALAQYPDLYEKTSALLFPQETRVRPELLGLIGDFVEKRGGMTEWLGQRAYEPSGVDGMNWGPQYRANAQAPAKTDLLTMTDPETGATHTTTRGAAQSAEAAHNSRLLGTMAVMGGAATLASGFVPGVRHLPFAARAGLSAAAAYGMGRFGEGKAAPLGGSHYTSDDGVPIRANTQFVKTNAFFDKLAYDVVERLGYWPSTSLREALLLKCAHSPITVLGVADMKEKVATLFGAVQSWNGDPCSAPELPLTSASDLFGRLLVR